MIITDIRGVDFPNCPRCGSDWKILHGDDWDERSVSYSCKDKECLYFNNHFSAQNKIEHVLSWFPGNDYLVEWLPEGMWILVYGEKGKVISNLQELTLPTLPYNISLDKLKTYILFS